MSQAGSRAKRNLPESMASPSLQLGAIPSPWRRRRLDGCDAWRRAKRRKGKRPWWLLGLSGVGSGPRPVYWGFHTGKARSPAMIAVIILRDPFVLF